MKINHKKIYIILLSVLSLTVAAVFFLVKYNSISAEKLEKELYSLDSTVTEAELEKMGYIDTTDTQESKNKNMEQFIQHANSRSKSAAICKTFQKQDAELAAKIFYYDPQQMEIRSWTYEPQKQRATAPDKRFSAVCRVVEQNNTVRIILENIKNTSIPAEDQSLQDEVLYSYFTK